MSVYHLYKKCQENIPIFLYKNIKNRVDIPIYIVYYLLCNFNALIQISALSQ